MEIIKKIRFSWLPWIALVIYAVITLHVNLTSGRICWFDEAHAWTIAANCNMVEIFNLLKTEGHTILWYLFLKPFALLFREYYPYPMLILNWFFACAALFIMIKKAPFSNAVKIFIIFSAPIFTLYINQARCYTMTICFLFAAMAFFKDRLKHPYKYLTCLILSANSHPVGAIPAIYLGMFFLYDLYKASYVDNIIDKRILSRVIIIAELVFLYMFSSYIGLDIPDYNVKDSFIAMPYLFRYFFLRFDFPYYIPFFKMLLFRLAIIFFTVYLFRKSIYAGLFWVLSAFTTGFFFSTVYYGRYYHIIFIFIYGIIAYWIYIQDNPDLKNSLKDIVNIIVTALTLYFCFMPVTIRKGNNFLGHTVLKDAKMRNAKIFRHPTTMDAGESLPEMEVHNVYLYDIKGRNCSKYEGLRYYYNDYKSSFDVDELYKQMSDTKDNFLISTLKIKSEELRGSNSVIYIKPYMQIYVNKIYMLSKKPLR